MTMDHVAANGLVLLGCGKMGSAMLAGWLKNGLPASSVFVIDPHPSDWLKTQRGASERAPCHAAPAIVLIAVKPQMMAEALPVLAPLGQWRHAVPVGRRGHADRRITRQFWARAPR